MSKVYLTLRQSEGVVTQAAATLYAAYQAAGRVSEGTEDEWMTRSVEEAIQLAQRCDQRITSDGEMG